MNIEHFGVTFWFNIFDDFGGLLEILKKELKSEFESFNYGNTSNDNLLMPVLSAVNEKARTNMHVTQISAQYNMDDVNIDKLDEFKDKALKLFDILTKYGIEILYSSVLVNSNIELEDAVDVINNSLINDNQINDDMIESNVRIAKKIDDQFYKVINVANNKQIKIEKKVDSKNRPIPLPLLSLNGSFVEKECINIDYEINDRYMYDFTKDYRTTDFYLNKMLFLVKENYQQDVDNFLSLK